MEVGSEFQARIAAWETMSRWERSELGKDLRRLGLSYGEIMDLIPVKKSTLATWCREVKLSEDCSWIGHVGFMTPRPPSPQH
jgi:hypothetical protein